jgi:hypothetical protein
VITERVGLPPTPAAVAAYFTRRRSAIAEFMPDELRHNERLWIVEICGLTESAAPAAGEGENGGSKAAESSKALTPHPAPHAAAVGRRSSRGGSGPATARRVANSGLSAPGVEASSLRGFNDHDLPISDQ